jgi:hypothetical protein
MPYPTPHAFNTCRTTMLDLQIDPRFTSKPSATFFSVRLSFFLFPRQADTVNGVSHVAGASCHAVIGPQLLSDQSISSCAWCMHMRAHLVLVDVHTVTLPFRTTEFGPNAISKTAVSKSAQVVSARMSL